MSSNPPTLHGHEIVKVRVVGGKGKTERIAWEMKCGHVEISNDPATTEPVTCNECQRLL